MNWKKPTRLPHFFFLVLFALGTGCGPRDDGKLPPPLPQSQRLSREQNRQHQLLEWTRNELLNGYEKAGRKNESWNQPVQDLCRAFAELHSSRNPSADQISQVKSAAQNAINAGCTDPLVRYFHLRHVLAASDGSTNVLPAQLNGLSKEISESDYSELRKFYANLRAAQELARIRPRSQTESGARLRDASEWLKRFLVSEPAPAEEVYLAASDLIATANRYMDDAHIVWNEIEPLLKKRLGKSFEFHLLRGEEFVRYAWKGRGGGFADKVTKQGWKLFADRLKVARDELLTAYHLDPYDRRIAPQMIEVCVGRESPRSEMELWFNRGMLADSNSVATVRAKVRYLEPRWFGSFPELIQFGRECVSNPAWGPSVPLELVQIHAIISSYEADWRPYYTKAAVYQDLRDAYVEYLRRNPEDRWERQNWLRYAYLAGDARDAREQYLLLNKKIDPNAYGTPELYREVKSFLENQPAPEASESKTK